MRAIYFLLSVVLLTAGCGGVTRTGVDHADDMFGRNVSATGPFVQLVDVVNRSKLRDELVPAVERYLVDQAVIILEGQCGYRMVLSPDMAIRLGEMQVGSAPTAGAMAEPDARVRVEILDIDEKLGATVKVGFVSKQKKYAVARLRFVVERNDGKRYKADGKGRASLGAWGVVASVRRDAMKQDGGVWDVGESMVGVAAREALEKAARRLPRRL